MGNFIVIHAFIANRGNGCFGIHMGQARPGRIGASLPRIRLDLCSVLCSQAVIGPDFQAQLLNGIGLGLCMVKGPEWPGILTQRVHIYFANGLGIGLTLRAAARSGPERLFLDKHWSNIAILKRWQVKVIWWIYRWALTFLGSDL